MSATCTTAKKQSVPCASATAARLGGYLTVSIGAGVLGTSQADAGIVTINIGPTGFNIAGPNAGLSTNSYKYVADFPFALTSTDNFGLFNQTVYSGDYYYKITGFLGLSGLSFGQSGGGYQKKFTAGQTIDPTTSFGSAGYFYYRYDDGVINFVDVAPAFGPGSYVAFKTAAGNYGWLEVTWNPSPQEFQIYAGAYESVPGVAIKAGDTGAAVPEIDPNSFGSALALVMGSIAVLEHRRRKRSDAESAAAALV